MARKPSYEELEQRVKELEEEVRKFKQDKVTLQECEENYRKILEKANGAILVAQDGKLRFVNPEAQKLFGYAEKELTSMPLDKFIHAEDRETVGELYEERLKGEVLPTPYPFKIVDKSGKVKWVELNVELFTWNKRPATLCFMKSIANHKQIEETLRKSEERYRSAFENTGMAMLIVEADMTISKANSGFEKLCGYFKEDIEGQIRWTEFVIKEDLERLKEHYFQRREKTGKAPAEYEFRLLDRRGNIRNVFVMIDMIPGTGKSVAALMDITSLKQTGKALQQDEERLRTVLEKMPVLMDAFDDNGNIIVWNKECERVTGYSKEEAINNPHIWESIYPDAEYRDYVLETIKRSAEDFRELEFNITRKDGSVRTISWSNISTDVPASGWSSWAIGIDVTARKSAEKKLRESEKRYRLIFDGSRDAIFITRADGKFLDVNEAASILTGYSKEELKKMVIPDLHKAEDLHAYTAYFHRIMKGEQISSEAKILRKDGTKVDTEFSNRMIMLEGLPRMHTVARDISERKQAQERLKQSEEKYRTIFETTGTATLVVQENTTISLANTEFEKLSGFSKEEIEDKKSWAEFFVEDQAERMKAYHRLRRTSPDAAPREYESRFIGRTGDVRDVFLTVAMIPESKQSVLSLLDITDRKRMENTLRESKSELEVQAHDLKEMNAALRVLLKRREDDKKELEENVLSNTKELIFPYLEKLKKSALDSNQKVYVSIVESNLEEIVSPFLRSLSSKYLNLSPMEIHVANLIKEGKTTKEIAEILGVSGNTILTHRYHLRTKLGLKKKKVNLRSYLKSLNI